MWSPGPPLASLAFAQSPTSEPDDQAKSHQANDSDQQGVGESIPVPLRGRNQGLTFCVFGNERGVRIVEGARFGSCWERGMRGRVRAGGEAYRHFRLSMPPRERYEHTKHPGRQSASKLTELEASSQYEIDFLWRECAGWWANAQVVQSQISFLGGCPLFKPSFTTT